jgi:hypothetical protein
MANVVKQFVEVRIGRNLISEWLDIGVYYLINEIVCSYTQYVRGNPMADINSCKYELCYCFMNSKREELQVAG